MNEIRTIEPFIRLGERLAEELLDGTIEPVIRRSEAENPWFSRANVVSAIQAVCTDMLDGRNLRSWLARYPAVGRPSDETVGIVMAGNIPLVGFFDLLCVLICDRRCLIKPSSKDRVLIGHIVDLLREIEPRFSIGALEGKVPDRLIASGSDEARRHFASVYPDTPSLLRGHRYSVAVLSGQESDRQLDGLYDDVFSYFGLGCRNVSRIFVPRGYDLRRLCRRLSARPITHTGYLNNYRQARAMRLLSGTEFIDGGFFLMRPGADKEGTLSEIACTSYERVGSVERLLRERDREIQCVVSATLDHPRRVDFGQAQHPSLTDYPDGIDVMEFLLAGSPAPADRRQL